METMLNLNDKKVIEGLNNFIEEKYVREISSTELETLLNMIAEEGTILVRVTGGHISSNATIYEHNEFEALISSRENENTGLIDQSFNIIDETMEKGNFSWDNLMVAQIYWNSWSNVIRVHFNESFESIEIEYQDIDIAAEELEVQA